MDFLAGYKVDRYPPDDILMENEDEINIKLILNSIIDQVITISIHKENTSIITPIVNSIIEQVTMHEEINKNKCNQFCKSFEDSAKLNKHLLLHQCGFCKKMFPHVYRKNRHMREVHEKSKTFICDICNTGFVNAVLLKRHRH